MRFLKRAMRAAVLISLAGAIGAAGPGACTPSAKSGASTPSAKAKKKPSQIPEVGKDTPGRSTSPVSNTDPCAERLHAACGPLLMFFVLNRRLPAKVDELKDLAADAGPGGTPLEFSCPVSGKPYVYVPDGVARGNGQPGRLVLFDASPAHSGMRWAVAVDPPRPGQPLVTKVVLEPETTFHTD